MLSPHQGEFNRVSRPGPFQGLIIVRQAANVMTEDFTWCHLACTSTDNVTMVCKLIRSFKPNQNHVCIKCVAIVCVSTPFSRRLAWSWQPHNSSCRGGKSSQSIVAGHQCQSTTLSRCQRNAWQLPSVSERLRHSQVNDFRAVVGQKLIMTVIAAWQKTIAGLTGLDARLQVGTLGQAQKRARCAPVALQLLRRFLWKLRKFETLLVVAWKACTNNSQ